MSTPREEALDAFNLSINSPQMVPCQKCAGRGYHYGFGEDGSSPDWCTECGGNQFNVVPGEEQRAINAAIDAFLSASAPADVAGLVERLHNDTGDLKERLLGQPGYLDSPDPLCEEAATVIADLEEERTESASSLQSLSAQVAELTRERDEALLIAKRVSRALTGLTTGGSEYHSYSTMLDEYFADVDACVKVVRDRFNSGHLAKIGQVDERRRAEFAEAQAASYRDVCERLREMLLWIDTYDPEYVAAAETKFGIDLRKRAALSNGGKEDGE